MFHNIMKCKVDESNVGTLIRRHQPSSKKWHCREAIVVILLAEITVIEQRRVKAPILWNKAGLIQSIEEIRINAINLFSKKILQETQAPPAALIPPALTTLKSRVCRSIGCGEHTTSPGRFAFESCKFSIGSDDGPAHRPRTEIEADEIVVQFSQIHSYASQKSDIFVLS